MTPPGAAPQVRQGPLRWLWFVAGLLAVAIGGIGVVMPGLPTTVFFIVAAACFARSNPRFERWILELPRIGPLVRDHRAGLGMPQRAKLVAVSMILLVSTASALLVEDARVRAAILGLGLIGAAYVGLRVPTREHVIARRSRADS